MARSLHGGSFTMAVDVDSEAMAAVFGGGTVEQKTQRGIDVIRWTYPQRSGAFFYEALRLLVPKGWEDLSPKAREFINRSERMHWYNTPEGMQIDEVQFIELEPLMSALSEPGTLRVPVVEGRLVRNAQDAVDYVNRRYGSPSQHHRVEINHGNKTVVIPRATIESVGEGMNAAIRMTAQAMGDLSAAFGDARDKMARLRSKAQMQKVHRVVKEGSGKEAHTYLLPYPGGSTFPGARKAHRRPSSRVNRHMKSPHRVA